MFLLNLLAILPLWALVSLQMESTDGNYQCVDGIRKAYEVGVKHESLL